MSGSERIAPVGRVERSWRGRGELGLVHKRGIWPLVYFSMGEKKDLEFQGLFLRWCPEGDSNSHSFRKRILNPPRLPIPPSGLNGGEV